MFCSAAIYSVIIIVTCYSNFWEIFVIFVYSVPPIVTIFSNRLVVLEDRNVNVTCGVTGIPVPKITWKIPHLPAEEKQLVSQKKCFK